MWFQHWHEFCHLKWEIEIVSQLTPNRKISMRSEKLMFNGLSFCTLCLAAFAMQTLTHDEASAVPQSKTDSRNLLQRVVDLEDRQVQNDVDFHLIDQSLNDLDVRVNDNQGRVIAQKRAIQAMQARIKQAMELIEVQRADARFLTREVENLRASLTER